MISKVIVVLCSLSSSWAKPNDLNTVHNHNKDLRRLERNPQYGGGGGQYVYSSQPPSAVTGYSYTTPSSLPQTQYPNSIQTQFPSVHQPTTPPQSIVAQPQQVYSLPQAGVQPQQAYFPPPLSSSQQQQQTYTTPQITAVTAQSFPQSTNFPSYFGVTQQSLISPVTGSGGINFGAPSVPPQTYYPANNNNNPSNNDSSNNQMGMPFDFKYSVNDNNSGNQHSHDSKSDGNTVTGSYKTLLPDGRTQVVSYTAGKDGYNAVVTYEGTANGPQGTQNSGSGQQGIVQQTGQQGTGFNQPSTGQQGTGFNQPSTGQQGTGFNQPSTGQQGTGFNQPSTGQQGTGFNQPSAVYQPPSY